MSILPVLDLETITKKLDLIVKKDEKNEIGEVIMLSFDESNNAQVTFENGKVKKAKNLKEKIQMYLQVLLRTELDKFEIYQNTNFGMTYFKFKGQKLPQSIIISEIKREIVEHLEKISLFDSIQDFKIDMNGVTLKLSFNLILKDDSFLFISI